MAEKLSKTARASMRTGIAPIIAKNYVVFVTSPGRWVKPRGTFATEEEANVFAAKVGGVVIHFRGV